MVVMVAAVATTMTQSLLLLPLLLLLLLLVLTLQPSLLNALDLIILPAVFQHSLHFIFL
jgi:hypothetical protein